MNKVVIEIDKVKNPYSGLGQFCINLGREIIATQPTDYDLEFALTRKADKPFADFGNYHLAKQLHRYTGSKGGDKTLWHATHQDSPFLPQRGTKMVLTIHDLNFLEKYTNTLRHKWRLRQIQKKIDRSSAIITISDFTANHVREHLNTRGLPLHVIYNGCVFPSESQSTPMQPVKGNFLFNIGIIQPRKNLEVLIPMMKMLPDYKLVLAGSAQPKYLEYLKDEVNQAGLHTRIIFTGPITDSEKRWYYEHCKAFVFPSRSEGFGLPVVEAMYAGKPIFLSTSTCLPEIGGKEAFYWDDFDPAQMKDILINSLSSWGPDQIEKVKERANLFNWRNSAEQYWEVYKSVL